MLKLVVTLACCAFAFSVANAAQVVVTDAKGPVSQSLKPGTVLDDGSLDVPVNSELTVMTASGEEIRIKGPHQGPVGAGNSGGSTMLQKLAMAIQERPASFGASRGLGFPPAEAAAQNPWVIDTTVSGTSCLFDGHPPMLWRSAAAARVQVTIENERTEEEASVDWPAGADAIAWPSSVPIEDGARYTVTIGDDHRTITLKRLSAASNAGSALMEAANAGCTMQARALLHEVKPVRVVSQ